MALAISCLLLAVLFIKDEQSYDRFHEKDIYRVVTHLTDQQGERLAVAGTGQPQGPAFREAVPEIKEYVRLMGGDITGDVIANNKTLHLQVLFTDPGFFDLFSFPLLRGNATTALDDISSVVITESVARKFFNSIDVIGKTMVMDASPSADKLGKPMLITGVAKDIPTHSSIRFEVLMPMRYLQLAFTDTNWLNQYLGTFMTFRPGSDINQVSKKFDSVFALHAVHQVAENKRLYNYDPQIAYSLQHVTDIHLNPMPTGDGWREGGIVNESNPVFSWLFLGIASFILFMAAINFVNISIASSLRRAKEIGVRKIAGGSKRQVVLQFLVESAVVCLAAFLLAIILAKISLPLFNELTHKQIELSEPSDAWLLSSFAGIFLLIVILTGFYPAYVLSKYEPKQVLYNRQSFSGRSLFGRSLVVFQFSLAVFFAIATIIYYSQMDFIRTRDLGYDPYQVVRTSIRGDRDHRQIQGILRYELEKEPAIKYLSFGSDGQPYDVKIGEKKIEVLHEVIDEYRLPTMRIKLKAGRNISSAIPADEHHSVVVNEAFVKAAGLESPLGTQLYTNERFGKELKTIVGVVEDYHSRSLHEPIRPMVMLACNCDSENMWVKIEKQNQQQALKALEAAYKKTMPTALFEYGFLDELNLKAYEQEQRWQKIIGIAAGLSIAICCFGLFGLTHITAHRRIKEIGIRKTLGASVTSIVNLLSGDFVKLVLIAIAIATPVAWWSMNKWLQNYAYRIDIEWWMFAAAGLAAVMIALVTISFQAIRAAVANPVEALRTE